MSIVTHHCVEIQRLLVPDGHFIVYRLGDDNNPATANDIAAFQEEVTEAYEEERPIVWNHLVSAVYAK